MVTYVMPICLECKHFHFDDVDKNACDAFQAGIPIAILHSDHDHHKPYAGDNGIQFEPLEKK